MSDWIHCNACFTQPLKNSNKRFSMTSCGHIFCCDCLDKSKIADSCLMCKNRCSKITLTKQMKPDIEMYFQDPAEQLKKAIKVVDFQKNHRGKFTRWMLKEQNEHVESNSKLTVKIKQLQKEILVLQQENNYMKKLLAGGIRSSISPSPDFIRSSPKSSVSGHGLTLDGLDSNFKTYIQNRNLGPTQNRLVSNGKSPTCRASPFTNERISIRTPPVNGQIGPLKYSDKPPTPQLPSFVQSHYERSSPSQMKFEGYPRRHTPGSYRIRQEEATQSDGDIAKLKRSIY